MGLNVDSIRNRNAPGTAENQFAKNIGTILGGDARTIEENPLQFRSPYHAKTIGNPTREWTTPFSPSEQGMHANFQNRLFLRASETERNLAAPHDRGEAFGVSETEHAPKAIFHMKQPIENAAVDGIKLLPNNSIGKYNSAGLTGYSGGYVQAKHIPVFEKNGSHFTINGGKLKKYERGAKYDQSYWRDATINDEIKPHDITDVTRIPTENLSSGVRDNTLYYRDRYGPGQNDFVDREFEPSENYEPPASKQEADRDLVNPEENTFEEEEIPELEVE